MEPPRTETRRSDDRMEATADRPAPRTAKAKPDRLLAVCAKCAKRQGFGRREIGRRIERALRRESPGCKPRVVGTACLGPCPKRAIAVATPESLSRRRVLLLDPSLASAAVRTLLPEPGTAVDRRHGDGDA